MGYLNSHLGLETTWMSSYLISSYGTKSEEACRTQVVHHQVCGITKKRSNDDSGDAGYGVWTARAFLPQRTNRNSPVKTFISSSKGLDSLTWNTTTKPLDHLHRSTAPSLRFSYSVITFAIAVSWMQNYGRCFPRAFHFLRIFVDDLVVTVFSNMACYVACYNLAIWRSKPQSGMKRN